MELVFQVVIDESQNIKVDFGTDLILANHSNIDEFLKKVDISKFSDIVDYYTEILSEGDLNKVKEDYNV